MGCDGRGERTGRDLWSRLEALVSFGSLGQVGLEGHPYSEPLWQQSERTRSEAGTTVIGGVAQA